MVPFGTERLSVSYISELAGGAPLSGAPSGNPADVRDRPANAPVVAATNPARRVAVRGSSRTPRDSVAAEVLPVRAEAGLGADDPGCECARIADLEPMRSIMAEMGADKVYIAADARVITQFSGNLAPVGIQADIAVTMRPRRGDAMVHEVFGAIFGSLEVAMTIGRNETNGPGGDRRVRTRLPQRASRSRSRPAASTRRTSSAFWGRDTGTTSIGATDVRRPRPSRPSICCARTERGKSTFAWIRRRPPERSPASGRRIVGDPRFPRRAECREMPRCTITFRAE